MLVIGERWRHLVIFFDLPAGMEMHDSEVRDLLAQIARREIPEIEFSLATSVTVWPADLLRTIESPQFPLTVRRASKMTSVAILYRNVKRSASRPNCVIGARSKTLDLCHYRSAAISNSVARFFRGLTQEKYWPAVEEAIRYRATGRQARLANVAARADEMRDGNAVENLRNRNPIDFLRRRADALSQRSAELRRLAEAWQPLYQTLTADQRQRLVRSYLN